MNLKDILIHKRTLLVGITLIVLTNAIALSGVAYNRSGEPNSQLVLTERELVLPYEYGFEAENSGIALRLDWRVFNSDIDQRHYGPWSRPDWIDKDKLATLGFDVSYPLGNVDSDQVYRKQRSKEVLLVLEYNGVAYQQALASARQYLQREQQLQQENIGNTEFSSRVDNAQTYVQQLTTSDSRLFVIDAGINGEALGMQYPDKAKYIITRGEIGIHLGGTGVNDRHLVGSIKQVSVEAIHVPLPFTQLIEPLIADVRGGSDGRPPRYQVTINYGLRFEPWITGIAEYNKDNAPL